MFENIFILAALFSCPLSNAGEEQKTSQEDATSFELSLMDVRALQVAANRYHEWKGHAKSPHFFIERLDGKLSILITPYSSEELQKAVLQRGDSETPTGMSIRYVIDTDNLRVLSEKPQR